MIWIVWRDQVAVSAWRKETDARQAVAQALKAVPDEAKRWQVTALGLDQASDVTRGGITYQLALAIAPRLFQAYEAYHKRPPGPSDRMHLMWRLLREHWPVERIEAGITDPAITSPR